MGVLTRLAPGALFAGRYEVIRLLAEGGMGTVYDVRDRGTGSRCALKVLLPELIAKERTRHRFAQEARVSAQIESPHVPTILDAGIDPQGLPYIAMELLEGSTLREFVKNRGPVPVEEARPILEQLTHALAAAHRIGLVHRDLKPENVFLQVAGGAREVKLLDFGVSKLIDAHRTSATGTGAIGSPMWMAPEQTSAGGRIAPATDIWALGLLAFHILTGKLFWMAAHDQSGVSGLLREMHLDPIPPASERAKVLVGPDFELPAGFDEWFAFAMQRDGTKRFHDAQMAMDALRAVLQPNPMADHSAVAFASTLAFESPVSAKAPPKPEPSASTTLPMGSSLRPVVPQAVIVRESKIPDTLGSGILEPVPGPAALEQKLPPAAIRPSIPETIGAGDRSTATPVPSFSRPPPSPSNGEGEEPVPNFSRPPPPMEVEPAGTGRMSPLAFILLLLVGGLVASALAAAIVWGVLTATGA